MTTIDHRYYEWLTSQINIPNQKTYLGLFERLHNAEFLWIVPNDDNRIQDGLDLRSEFTEGEADSLDLDSATFLEVLVALSRRVSFNNGGEPAPQWAWVLLKNIGLTKTSDPITKHKADHIDNVIYRVIWRTYRPDGRGGFFPLQNPEQDQTKLELWYQMNKYVGEMTDH